MKKLIFGLTFLSSFFFASHAFGYTVQSGDTMTEIAKKTNLTLQQLAEANPQISDIDLIFVGQDVITPEPYKIPEPYKTSEPYNTPEPYYTAKPYKTPEPKAEKNSSAKISYSDYEIDLLARLVSAEAKGEPFEGKIAVACVVLNRVESKAFPNNIRDVIYEPGQFQPVKNGQINNLADEESIKAVNAALTEQRNLVPGSLFFYNPSIATSRWLDSRTTTQVIGQHVFKE